MREAYSLIWSVLVLLFRSRVSLEAEILILRHQLNIQRRHLPKRLAFQDHGSPDLCWAVSFGAKYHQGADDCEAGHRHPLAPVPVSDRIGAGNRGAAVADPLPPLEIRRLIREMSIANPCGERRESMESFSSSASMSARPASPSIWRGGGALPRRDGRRSFATMRLALSQWTSSVVPTISFRLLYGLLIMGHGRRQILWLG